MTSSAPARAAIVVGGASFLLAALAFVGVFSYLAATFDYPQVLDGAASDVLPRLRAGGDTMRAVWALYAFLPLILLPGAVGARAACPASPHRMRLATALAAIASFSMCLGLMRWPSVHWKLAEAFVASSNETRASLAVVFDGLNVYLGNYIGEFLGETTLALFFLLCGLSMRREAYPRWLGALGIVFAVSFLVGAFRNVAGGVQVVADVNNVLLPLWMGVLGAAMIRYRSVTQAA